MITDADVRAAEMRMQATLDTAPRAIAARYDRRVSRIVISLSSGLELAFPPHIVEGLSEAKPADLMDVEISPTGLGLHFPKIDADLYIPSLLDGVFGSSNWMASAWANWVVHLAQKPKLPRRETTENSEADPEKQRSKSLLPILKPCISDSVGFREHTILSKMR